MTTTSTAAIAASAAHTGTADRLTARRAVVPALRAAEAAIGAAAAEARDAASRTRSNAPPHLLTPTA